MKVRTVTNCYSSFRKYEIRGIIAKYNHLRDVKIVEKDGKAELPVHLVIGTNEYTKIKTETPPKICKQGEPIAEKT